METAATRKGSGCLIREGVVRPWEGDRMAHSNGVNDKIENAFHNDLDAQYIIRKEAPRHRLMVFLAAQGKQIKEIAERLGVTPNNVSNVLRQTWARERMVNEMQEAGIDELRQILSGEAKASIVKLVNLRDGADSEQVQLAAADKLLDRFLGKPTQPIRDETDPSKLAQMTDDELARIAGRTTSTGTSPS